MLAAALLVAVLVAAGGGAAGAQDGPYGSTTTTTAPDSGLEPTCAFELRAAAPGASGTLRVTNVPFGGTVRVLIGGVESGRATAPLAAQGAAAGVRFGGAALPAQARATTLDVPFTVPDLPPGLHTVTAVGANFTITCDPSSGIEVLGDLTEDDDSRGRLPRTGIYLLLLVLIALLLLLVGRALVSKSRRRRRERERAQRLVRAAAGHRRSE